MISSDLVYGHEFGNTNHVNILALSIVIVGETIIFEKRISPKVRLNATVCRPQCPDDWTSRSW